MKLNNKDSAMLKKLKKLLFGDKKSGKNDCQYRCINCGSSVKDLYKNYSSTIQKLAECVCLNWTLFIYKTSNKNSFAG